MNNVIWKYKNYFLFCITRDCVYKTLKCHFHKNSRVYFTECCFSTAEYRVANLYDLFYKNIEI